MITILLNQGRIEGVFGTNDYLVVNLDLLEAGKCPVCLGPVDRGTETQSELTGAHPFCPACSINWDETNLEEVISRLTSPRVKFWNVMACLTLLEWSGIQAESDLDAIEQCNRVDVFPGMCLDRLFWMADPDEQEEGG